MEVSSLIEITGDDIAELGDSDLRELIGRLCEADYRLARLSTSGITWGGHQDAADGGLDVVVRSKVSPPVTSFVPKNLSGFQVKRPKMPRAKILMEMCPEGVLRKPIKAFLQDRGAYIIVSSGDSTSETSFKNRTKAMKEAVAGKIKHDDFCLDFLDRGRVATWVRSHPSMVAWVREKIGKPLNGWRSYGNWARTPRGVEEEYILDDGLRLYDETDTTNQKLSVIDGLLKLRLGLSTPGTSIRLVGLSGIGKTRLVQALFDSRVGNNALNPSQAIYTDIADGSIPDPAAMASQLINDQRRAILIVDNCPPDLHHRMVQICSGQQGSVSLLTVEYDVRDDLPEETRVFRLEPASEEVIEKLIGSRKEFAHISPVDAGGIASFSGGNARVAIALANTVGPADTLSSFRDEQLFERLFTQRHHQSQSLLISAQVCSLLYSFEGADLSTESSEIKFLASLVDKSSNDLYRDIAELRSRGLIQSRGGWRAVLPHAIANRLAKRALESIPNDFLVNAITLHSERVIRSFTRRLSYLHDCNEAIGIVDDWLAPNGWVGKSIDNLDSVGIAVLKNIAPVSPVKMLEAIERTANGSSGEVFTSKKNRYFSEFVSLLRHLAYDPELFDRSAKLLCRFAFSESKGGGFSQAHETLKSLFYIYLSGTQARVEARAKVISRLIDSADKHEQELGLSLLEASLKTSLFNSSYEFSFGARPRDYGYRPKTREEIIHWFNTMVDLCVNAALSGQSNSKQAKKMLEDNMRGLWRDACAFDAIEESVKKILRQGAWHGGWIAICRVIQFDRDSFDDETKVRLYSLEKLLKPSNLLEKARAFALSDSFGTFDLEGDFDREETASEKIHRTEETTRKIGVEVAQNAGVLKALLPEIVSTDNSRLFNLGVGLAEGCVDKGELFDTLYTELGKTPQEARQIQVFLGFLSFCAEADPDFYNSILDELIKDKLLGEWFPIIQLSTTTLDQNGIKRLNKALEFGKSNIHQYQNLGVYESISDDDLAGLLKKIYLKKDGVSVALEILQMRFHIKNKETSKYSNDLMEVSCDVLTTFSFKDEWEGGDLDYKLAQVVGICLDGLKGSDAATILYNNIKEAILEGRASCNGYPLLINSLAKTQPTLFMDVFLDENVEDFQIRRMFNNGASWYDNPLGQVSDTNLTSWCEMKPSSRYPLVALAIDAFEKSDETGRYKWNPFVYTIFEKAPSLKDILHHFAKSLIPTSWSGSLAEILQSRSVLCQDLYEHENEEVAAWAKDQYMKLQAEIISERERESREARERNERFE